MLNVKNKAKRIIILSIASLTLFLNSCNFNQSVNKDFKTQAYSRGNGLSCKSVSIRINEKEDNRNEYIYGEKVNFSFNNIEGFNRIKGKAFPSLSLIIIDNKKDTVLQHTDLLDDFSEGTDLDPMRLYAHFIAALPYKNNEKYIVLINIKDKKGDGTFTYEMPFTIKENKLLNIKSKGIDYSTIYLWDDTKKLTIIDGKIDLKNDYVLIYEGLSGLKSIENNVYPTLSIELIDNNGDEVLSNPNILEEFKISGIDETKLFEGQIPVTISFNPGEVSNPCKLKAVLIDQNSDKRIDIVSEIELK